MRTDNAAACLKPFGKVVIWGLRRSVDSFRYIHQHFHETLVKIGADVVWCDDLETHRDIVRSGDLVFAVNVAAKHLPIVKGAFYVLHNTGAEINDQIPLSHRITLQVYTKASQTAPGGVKWMSGTYYYPETRMLVQPWGTNLLPSEFMPPVSPKGRNRKMSFWVGAIWQNPQGQGNINEIAAFKRVLALHGKRFQQLRFIPNSWNAKAVRWSCVAPAVAGAWQAENHYLPCRMFKNISYGQLGLSNVLGFDDILGDAACLDTDIGALVDRAMSFGDKAFTETIAAQQEAVKQHTYVGKIQNIVRAITAS